MAHAKSSYGRILDAVKLTASTLTRRESSLARAAEMDDRSAPLSRGPDRGRWLMVAALILLGVALYFWFAPSSPSAAPPALEVE
jgi:hypothetical protein